MNFYKVQYLGTNMNMKLTAHVDKVHLYKIMKKMKNLRLSLSKLSFKDLS